MIPRNKKKRKEHFEKKNTGKATIFFILAILSANLSFAQKPRYEKDKDEEYESIVRLNAGVGFCATSDSFMKKTPMYYSFGMTIGGGISFLGLTIKAPVSMLYQEYDSILGKIIRFPAGDIMWGFTVPRRLTSIFAGTGGGLMGSIGIRSGNKFYPDAPLGGGGFAQLCLNWPQPIFENMVVGLTTKVNYIGYIYQRKTPEYAYMHRYVVYNWVPQVEAMLTIGFLSKTGSNTHYHTTYYKDY
jgi:hypothetical protein